MDIKPYDLALYVGRFQPLHIGHISSIKTALKICDRVLILVGSAQESGTLRNPFDVETRMSLIKEIFGDKVIVKPLVDMTDETDICPEWGKYLMDAVKGIVGKVPDVMVYGDEDVAGWFSEEDMKDTMRVVLPRARVGISATQLREYLVTNNMVQFFKYSHPKTHKHFGKLRDEMLKVVENQSIKESKNIMEGQTDFA